jgi:hypothetical protein
VAENRPSSGKAATDPRVFSHKMTKPLSRRRFLTRTGALGLGTAVLPAGTAFAAPSKKIRHACIGAGGMGHADFKQFLSHSSVEIVAVCDVDTERAKGVRAKVPNAKFYQDWRELLANEKIDSVNVSTPDHMHAPITMTALSAGPERLLPETAHPRHLRIPHDRRQGRRNRTGHPDGHPARPRTPPAASPCTGSKAV